MQDTILSVQNIKNYFTNNKSKEILKGVSFDIKKGEIFGLIGESGSGKTTLAMSVAGLIDYDGDILINNEILKKKRTLSQRKNIQMVFQDPFGSLNPKKKIGWILEQPLIIHKAGTHTDRLNRINEVLKLVGLDERFKDRYPHELSGGQRQRVSIACSLILNPSLIIADEAVSALDVSTSAQILNLFNDLHDKLNLSMLFISHNLNVVYYLCSRVAVLYRGLIVELAAAEELYRNPLHPYTKLLLNSSCNSDCGLNNADFLENDGSNQKLIDVNNSGHYVRIAENLYLNI